MGNVPGQNGWNEYSRLVLKALDDLAQNITELRTELSELRRDIDTLKSKEDRVEDLREWKAKIDEVVSPTQLKDKLKTVEDLKTFKTKAITAFAVIQVGMGVWAWASKFF